MNVVKTDSVIKTRVSLIFTNSANMVLNYPYSRTRLLGTKDFTIQELREFGDSLIAQDFINRSCFSQIDFSYTLNIEKSTKTQETKETSELFIFATQKEPKPFCCNACSISDCADEIKNGKCPCKPVHSKLFETFQEKEH